MVLEFSEIGFEGWKLFSDVAIVSTWVTFLLAFVLKLLFDALKKSDQNQPVIISKSTSETNLIFLEEENAIVGRFFDAQMGSPRWSTSNNCFFSVAKMWKNFYVIFFLLLPVSVLIGSLLKLDESGDSPLQFYNASSISSAERVGQSFIWVGVYFLGLVPLTFLFSCLHGFEKIYEYFPIYCSTKIYFDFIVAAMVSYSFGVIILVSSAPDDVLESSNVLQIKAAVTMLPIFCSVRFVGYIINDLIDSLIGSFRGLKSIWWAVHLSSGIFIYVTIAAANEYAKFWFCAMWISLAGLPLLIWIFGSNLTTVGEVNTRREFVCSTGIGNDSSVDFSTVSLEVISANLCQRRYLLFPFFPWTFPETAVVTSIPTEESALVQLTISNYLFHEFKEFKLYSIFGFFCVSFLGDVLFTWFPDGRTLLRLSAPKVRKLLVLPGVGRPFSKYFFLTHTNSLFLIDYAGLSTSFGMISSFLTARRINEELKATFIWNCTNVLQYMELVIFLQELNAVQPFQNLISKSVQICIICGDIDSVLAIRGCFNDEITDAGETLVQSLQKRIIKASNILAQVNFAEFESQYTEFTTIAVGPASLCASLKAKLKLFSSQLQFIDYVVEPSVDETAIQEFYSFWAKG